MDTIKQSIRQQCLIYYHRNFSSSSLFSLVFSDTVKNRTYFDKMFFVLTYQYYHPSKHEPILLAHCVIYLIQKCDSTFSYFTLNKASYTDLHTTNRSSDGNQFQFNLGHISKVY